MRKKLVLEIRIELLKQIYPFFQVLRNLRKSFKESEFNPVKVMLK